MLTEKSQKRYKQYRDLADTVLYLFVCGRLGNFKYYNMDQALEEALKIVQLVLKQ